MCITFISIISSLNFSFYRLHLRCFNLMDLVDLINLMDLIYLMDLMHKMNLMRLSILHCLS